MNLSGARRDGASADSHRGDVPKRMRARGPVNAGLSIATASLLVVALAACSQGGEPAATNSEGDLELKLGTVLPQTGNLAVLGPPEFAGVDLAVQDINDAGAGLTIAQTNKDSGDSTTDIASTSARALISDGNSVIVGAASSGVSMNIIDQITGAGVVQISPANTSPDFTDYDDGGYYWRTAPSDVLQGQALGQKVVADGHQRVSILYMNDSYGVGLHDNVKSTLEANGIEIAAEQTFEPAASNFSAEVSTVLAPGPDALVVISFDEIKSIAQQLEANGFDFANLYGSDGNYGVLSESDTKAVGAQFSNPGIFAPEDFQQRLQDLVASQGAEPLTVFSYAAESYDATVVSALAALQGEGTSGEIIKDNLESVSKDGTKCTEFKECADLIAEGTDIDYDGISGPIAFDSNGDVTEATISFYKITGDDNSTEYVDSQTGKLG